MAGQDALRTALLALLLVGACRCDDSPGPVRKAEAPREPKSEGPLPTLPALEGEVFDPAVLATALPAALGDAQPEGEARTESSPLSNGGSTASASRTYVKEDLRITVQINDLQHAPLLRQAMSKAKDRIDKGGGASTWKFTLVQGHDAMAQHIAAQQMAIANVMATERLFVNVRVEPAESTDIALEWANKLPLEAITKLAAPGSAPAPGSQPPPM